MSPAVRTRRLLLVPATLAHLDADLAGPHALAALLGARVPPGWPPGELDRGALEFFRSRLLEHGDAAAPWYAWYAVTTVPPATEAALVGSCGFRGPPAADGSVEIGYSVVEGERGRGWATEMARALAAHALSRPGVTHVTAEARDANVPSVRVLERLGFVATGPGREPGTRRWRSPEPR